MPRLGLLSAILTCFILMPIWQTARAEPLDPLTQTLHFDLGFFFLEPDTTIRVDGTSGAVGSDIDLKHDFGFEQQDRFRLDGYWRFFKRHRARFMYFDSSSSADRTLTRNIEFGDTLFPVNASAHLDFKTQIIEGAYEYSFMQSDTFELAGTIGLHYIKLTTDLSAAVAAGQAGRAASLSSSADTNGPLPVIGLHFTWALSNQFYFDGIAQFFKAKFDNYDGNLQDYKLDFVWQPFKNFGLGVGYNQFTTRLDVTQDRFDGSLKFGYGGPRFFLTTAF